jgi:predicted dehydrogenase
VFSEQNRGLTVRTASAIETLNPRQTGFPDLSAPEPTGTTRHLPTFPGTAHRIDDRIAVTGILESGAVAAVHYRGGVSRSTNFLWEINGTEGDLLVTGGSGHLQFGQVTIHGARWENTELFRPAGPSPLRHERPCPR